MHTTGCCKLSFLPASSFIMVNKKRISEINEMTVSSGTGEALPTLVRRSDWIPVGVATRWAVRHRRFECMPSTLGHELWKPLPVPDRSLAHTGTRRNRIVRTALA